MTWHTITGAGVSIATKFFGDTMNKISNMFETVDISDVVKIHTNVTWTFDGSALRVRDSDDSNSYIFVGGDIAADRNINLPVLTGDGTMAFVNHIQQFTVNQTFNNTIFRIRNPANDASYSFTSAAIAADRIITLPLMTTGGTMIVTGLANQIGDTEITAHTTTKITTTNKSLLNSAIVYTDQTNVYGDFNQDFQDNRIRIERPAGGGVFYNIAAGAITAARALNLPVTTATDTFAVLGLAQTFTGAKTFGDIIHTGRHQLDKGANIVAADAPTLGGDGNVFHITGTGTINHFQNTNWQLGSQVTLIFDAAATVNHNTGGEAGDEASIFLAGTANKVYGANQVLLMTLDTSTRWLETDTSGGGGSLSDHLHAGVASDGGRLDETTEITVDGTNIKLFELCLL